MRLAELQQVLRAVEPAAVLVAPRVLANVLEEVLPLQGLIWTVPHAESWVADRQVLFRYAEQDELNLPGDLLLPEKVILLAQPSREELNDPKPANLLLRYWRRLFHAAIHRVLEGRQFSAEDIDQRIKRLGHEEFAEIRQVLVSDHRLATTPSDLRVYIEFAALYWELRFFAAQLVTAFFPGLRDLDQVDALLAEDLDARKLFAHTRLAGAAEPDGQTDEEPDEAHEYYWRLIRAADKSATGGNVVRSAILRQKASRVAPWNLAASTRLAAVSQLQDLVKRILKAVQGNSTEASEWDQALPHLLDKADQGNHPLEAALLYDLQNICLDHERDVYAFKPIEWLLSLGQRPLQRPLPMQKLVRILGHLRSAASKLTAARLADADRLLLHRLLQQALKQCEEHLRSRVRPIITAALEDVGLQPHNALERAALDKMVEEMLLNIVQHGFITFSDLRDIISRNQLKLPDLKNPQDFIQGDALLRLDRRLAAQLDSVYRPSEIYLRWLERLSALNFGTNLGRLLTHFITIPFGGAYLCLEGLSLLLHVFRLVPSRYEETEWTVKQIVWPILGCFFLGLMHSASLRQRTVDLGRSLLRGLRWALWDCPRWLVQIPALHRLVSSGPVQFLYWYGGKPLLMTLAIWSFLPDLFHRWHLFPELFDPAWYWVGLFLFLVMVMNSTTGVAVQRLTGQVVAWFIDMLRSGLIPGLVRLIIFLLKQFLYALEFVLFTVDEWLRFRSGDGLFTRSCRVVLSVAWAPISYFARFYMVVLIEPCLHPVKLPIASIATKLMLPILPTLSAGLNSSLEPVLGTIPAWFFAYTTVFFLPDFFGFLFWETKENWKLFGANRSPFLQPATIGSHGETMRGLLQPGFHSGTIPKAFARLRKASQTALDTGNGRDIRAAQQHLDDIETVLRRFLATDLVGLVREAHSWQGHDLQVGPIHLTVQQFTFELVRAEYPDRPLRLSISNQEGYLVGRILEPGWLPLLEAEQRRAFNTALASFYKFAAIDVVPEQVQAQLPHPGQTVDVIDHSLVLWLDSEQRQGVRWELGDKENLIAPQVLDGVAPANWPALTPHQLLFAEVPLTWKQCRANWEQDQQGLGHPPLLVDGRELTLLRPAPVASPSLAPALQTPA